jgi:hypothetical protein
MSFGWRDLRAWTVPLLGYVFLGLKQVQLEFERPISGPTAESPQIIFFFNSIY